jgi:hypothetical protein
MVQSPERCPDRSKRSPSRDTIGKAARSAPAYPAPIFVPNAHRAGEGMGRRKSKAHHGLHQNGKGPAASEGAKRIIPLKGWDANDRALVAKVRESVNSANNWQATRSRI